MIRHLPLLLLLLSLAAPTLAKPKKPSVPEDFATAHTVFVETRDGRDITDISLDPETRSAILDLQDAVEHWGRYTLSRSRHDADLILVLYKGRLLRSQPDGQTQPPGTLRVPIGHSPIQDPADASQASNSGNSPDGFTQEKDELRVYTLGPNDKLKNLLWHGEEERGLTPPRVLLLQRLKNEVDNSYPPTPANPQPTP